MRTAMRADYSWDHSAREYLKLYRDLLTHDLPSRDR
jgi:glycogen synthase